MLSHYLNRLFQQESLKYLSDASHRFDNMKQQTLTHIHFFFFTLALNKNPAYISKPIVNPWTVESCLQYRQWAGGNVGMSDSLFCLKT